MCVRILLWRKQSTRVVSYISILRLAESSAKACVCMHLIRTSFAGKKVPLSLVCHSLARSYWCTISREKINTSGKWGGMQYNALWKEFLAESWENPVDITYYAIAIDGMQWRTSGASYIASVHHGHNRLIPYFIHPRCICKQVVARWMGHSMQKEWNS